MIKGAKTIPWNQFRFWWRRKPDALFGATGPLMRVRAKIRREQRQPKIVRDIRHTRVTIRECTRNLTPENQEHWMPNICCRAHYSRKLRALLARLARERVNGMLPGHVLPRRLLPVRRRRHR